MGKGFRENQPGSQFEPRYNTTLAGVVNTFEWLLIAVVLAFVFRAFVVEAFRIPTGSMAETLRGDHYHLRCPRCGYEYDLGTDEVSELPHARCPSCAYWASPEVMPAVTNGDRIFVSKAAYQFKEPDRWDVVVFKYPIRPEENYIKRLIAKPGETVELIDGDVYIDGLIRRKPPKVQDELWMPLYINDYQPGGRADRLAAALEDKGPYTNQVWQQPFENVDGSIWNTSVENSAVFSLVSPQSRINTLHYVDRTGHDFEARYAYNSNPIAIRPEVSDLRVVFNVTSASDDGMIGAGLKKNNVLYRGWVDFAGQMIIDRFTGEQREVLVQRDIPGVSVWNGSEFSFEIVDHMVVLRIGENVLKYDAGRQRGDMGVHRRDYKPGVEIYGASNIDISHIEIWRDMYYGSNVLRPRPNEPFTLDEDEYFMAGDNSPISHDSRMWRGPGIGNEGRTYREGIVPRGYLVGKAFFLYWGDAYKPFEGALPIVPNLGKMKPIYGGVDENE
ncbi:Signal peptidase I [Anaerohalosphaera lusitana]|uniref:Signal peptidase I n=1 Tax=Anaerohalosphaera lusitana TaxID=1936003 RepID=A0A1U9NNV4_9BACT|nr:signal peptidase I [Anaerohalosphaera lusitana]AQT69414.1 Signal peptidase I [Anaerohalosphaera lusitana]